MSKNYKPVFLENGAEILNNYELLSYLRDNESILKTDLLLSFYLAIRRNSVTARCFPGKKTIAKNTGLSESGIKKSIKNLEALGIIIVVNFGEKTNENSQTTHDGKTVNSYYFCYDLEYQGGLIEDERHPMQKMEDEKDLFDSALLKFRRGH